MRMSRPRRREDVVAPAADGGARRPRPSEEPALAYHVRGLPKDAAAVHGPETPWRRPNSWPSSLQIRRTSSP